MQKKSIKAIFLIFALLFAAGTILAEEPKVPNIGLFRKLEEEVKNLELKRDPFAAFALTPAERSVSELRLTGIVWDKESPKAIINDFIVGIGERIGINTIMDIKKDRVILNDGTGYFELRLGQ